VLAIGDHLIAAGFTVREVPPQLSRRERARSRRPGKSDPGAAMALSWRHRIEAGRSIDLPVLELGPALIALLPGEAHVEYQLLAQRLRPDAFVMALGYGESATGYIPTSRQIAEDGRESPALVLGVRDRGGRAD
jgi:hypothetical protein